MRRVLFVFMAILFAPQAYGEENRTDFLSSFVVGRYQLIGRQPEAGGAYHGVVEIVREGPAFVLTVKRTIAGQMVVGSAAVESALNGEVAVVRMRFRDNPAVAEIESTCLVHGDLDNYARLTCQLYRKDGGTRRAGLEALFPLPAE